MFGILFFLAVIAGWLLWRNRQKTVLREIPLPADYNDILEKEVAYFRKLNNEEKKRFEADVIAFLQQTRIEGIGTHIDDTDRLLVASSAVIPVFGFPEWTYNNLSDVLIYDDHFNGEFSVEGQNRQFMGMVGSGYMNGKMLLSKPALREGFSNKTDKNNTAIHEFVHLLDKYDGAIDGIPEALVDKQFVIPWLDLVHQKMKDILAGKSDINPYGATDKTEFFAVAAEYFFERPDLLKIKHPQLFEMLEKIFKQDP
ncbi:zinc-dependent peptidase [Flavihumibacter fluvii]|uniref:M90 family metallopeptidase n=1 Tax=Flavihumibacter fluvii TaxID=2838157 RepID=UPI001BDF27A9|nr:M90 family metallopeptidase [Flavihumibacter fluvii]ULQ51393.1 zinc-dependent peptidase [Flavihumibacter fluvii]